MKLSKEVVVAKGMSERGTPARRLAGQIGVTEGALRYRAEEMEASPGRDGRADQRTALDGYAEVVEAIQVALEDGSLTGEGRPGSGPADLRDPRSGPRVRGQLPDGGAVPERTRIST